MPKLHTVTGKVLRSQQPLKDAMVSLVPDDPELARDFTINGITDSDGEVKIETLEARTNKRSSGAPEGSYRIVVNLPYGADQSGGGSFEGRERFNVQAGGNNKLPNLEAPPPKKK